MPPKLVGTGLRDRLSSFFGGRGVLVTGSTGFKGSWLCRTLLHLGAKVSGYALEPPTNPSLFDLVGLGNQMDQTVADVRDLDALRRCFERTCPHAVLHLAAQPLVIDSYRRPRHTYETNVMGTVNVLECVRSCESVRTFLNVTTDKVYENLECPGYGYKEDDKLDGFDPYSNSKSCSELVTHSYARSFFAPGALGAAAGRCAISTARAGNVIGGGDFADNRIVPDCVRAARSGTVMTIRNPSSVRPYQHVLEPLLLYLTLVMRQDEDASLAGWYNVGPDDADCVTTGQIVGMFADAWGDGFSFEERRVDGPHEAGLLRLDNSKAKDKLGWQPVWDVREALRRTVEWSRAWVVGGTAAASDAMDKQIDDYLEELI